MTQKVFAVGDIHGRVKALKEVLVAAKFDYKKDKLIIMGDVVDGGYHTYEVVEELLKIENKILVLGNHDVWFMDHIRSGWSGEVWISQGGKNTIESYKKNSLQIPVTHQDFFNRGVYYYEQDNMLFVHGGINPDLPIEKQEQHTLLWDRSIINYARNNRIGNWDKVFIGHTSTQNVSGDTDPIRLNNLYMTDCGAGWDGRLCLTNIHTGDSWLSELQVRPK